MPDADWWAKVAADRPGEKPMADDIIRLIKEYGLLVRPSLASNWRAGVWRGVHVHASAGADAAAYCEAGSEVEAESLEDAVRRCVERIKRPKA